MAVNNVLKDKDDNILNPKISRYEILKNQLLDGSSPIKTGRKINGEDEYVFRRNIGILPNNSSLEYDLPIEMGSILPTRGLDVYGVSTSGEMIPIPRHTGSSYVSYYITTNGSRSFLALTTNADLSRFVGYLNMYFIYQ